MSYNKKTWTDRTSEYPNRYRMTYGNGNIADVAIVPYEGEVSTEGEKFSAQTMNDMEQRIDNGFTDADSSITSTLNTAKAYTDVEKQRAQGAENLMQHDIETNSTNIANEITRAQGAESTISTNLSNEITRAQGIESGLRTDVNSLTQRMGDAESDVDTLTSRISTLETDVELEAARAEGAETTLQGNIDSEEARATSAEGILETAITNEVTRATGAENTLSTNLANEVTRAQGAESTLTTDLANEVLRATAAESALHDYVDEKASMTYKPSGSIYFADLPALTESRVGNVYDIKDDFTTTSDFMEGAGKSYKAGTNVAIEWGEETIVTVTYDEVTPVGTEDPSDEGWYELQTVGTSEEYVLTEDTTVDSGKTYYEKIETPSIQRVLKYDCMSAFVNLSNYVQKTDLATNVNAGIVKPDGTTITVDADGTIHSVGGGQGSAEAAERMIAPIEPDATESIRAYSVGQRLILDEVLYEVTQAIAIGDALVENTNIEETNPITDFDTTPTQNSTKFVTSGGVYSYIDTMITQALAASY